MNTSAQHIADIGSELKRALHFQKAGRLAQAEKIYRRILEFKHAHADALHLLGVLCRQKGDTARAKVLINQAIAIDGTSPLFYVSLGDVLQDEKKYPAAVFHYRKALGLKPDSVEALCNLANALRENGDLRQAIDIYTQCLAINSNLPQVHNNMGLAYYNQDQYDQAEACFKAAVVLNSHYAEAYNNLGNVYRDQSRFEEAISHYQKALYLMPENSLIHYNLGLAFQMGRQFNRAQEYYLKTIELDSQSADAYNNLGKLLHDQNLPAQAIENYDKAIQIDAGHFDAHFNRSLSLLAGGRFEEGWPEYEWRFKRNAWRKIYPHRLAGPRWDGANFDGQTLLVHCEQGFGDTIQFIRYLPRVKDLGGTVVFEAQSELCELLQGFAGIDSLLPMSFEHPSLRQYDMQIPLMSLPGLFGTTLDTIPESVPYIQASLEKLKPWQDRISGPELKIGLTWAAKTTYTHDKSCAPHHFLPLTELPGMRIFGLQKGSPAKKTQNIPTGIINLGEEFETFADTAAAIDCLDLVISVDTAVAHLAGAMGKPVWVLLPFAADWRWLLERRNSPWYPTMRLFRQQHPCVWKNVLDQVVTELCQSIETSNLFCKDLIALSDESAP